MIDDPYSFEFMETITDCHFGDNWVQAKMQYLAGGAVEHVDVTQTFPGMAGGTPGFTYMTDGVNPVTLPLFSVPVSRADLTATVKTGAGKSLTGFGRRLPATPPPAKPGGATGYWFKINSGLNSGSGFLQIRFNFSGVVSGSWNFSVATTKKLAVGMQFDDPDFFSFAQKLGSTSGGDTPPPTVDFRVDLQTLQVTLL